MNFLKISLCTFILSLLMLNVNAQKPRLGVKLGADLDRTSGKGLTSDFNGFILAGVYAGVEVKKVRIQAELLFSKSTITTTNSFRDIYPGYVNHNVSGLQAGKFNMTELSIPVTAGFNIIPKLLWIEIGPQYTSIVSIQDVNSFLTETKNVFSTGYISGLIGATVELPFNLNAGLRYVIGITDRNNTTVNDAWRTNHIQVHAGFCFLR